MERKKNKKNEQTQKPVGHSQAYQHVCIENPRRTREKEKEGKYVECPQINQI